MSATPLDPTQLQAEAQALEAGEAWDPLLRLVQQQRPWHAQDERLSGYLDYLAGRALLEQQQLDQAIPLLRSAAAALPEVPFTHNLLGRALAEQQQWLSAAAAQQRCLSLKPDFGYAWLELGRAREALADSEGAEEAYRQALPLLPDNTWLQRRHASLRITLLLRAGEGLAAAAAISEELRRGPIPAARLIEWLELTAALLAGGQPSQAAMLAASISSGAEQAARPSPLASRCSLLLHTLSVLLADEEQSNPDQDLHHLAGALQESLWLPNDAREDAFWRGTLSGLCRSAGERRLRGTAPMGQERLALLLSLAELVGARFGDHHQALGLLQAALLQPNLDERQRNSLAERAGLAALNAARAAVESGEARRLLATAIQALQAVPTGSRSIRTETALNDSRLILAGFDLPTDLSQLRSMVDQLFTSCGTRHLPGHLRHDLDQLLWRLNSTVLADTAALAHRSGRISEAQALRRKGLLLLAELTSLSLNPPGLPPLPARKRPIRRWLFLASSDLPQCFLYRVEQKRAQLEGLDQEVLVLNAEALSDWGAASALLWADVLLVCRLPGTYPILRAISLAQRFGIDVYYDIDDLIMDAEHFPPSLSSYGGTVSANVHTGLALDAPLFEVAMRQADAVIVSTPTLARRWRELAADRQQPVLVLPNLAQPTLCREATLTHQRLERTFTDDPVRLLVSSGTLAHKQVWADQLAPAIAEVLQRHPQVLLDLVGSLKWPEGLADTFSDRIREIPFSDYSTYLHHIGQAHIGLAPLEPGIVTDAKSAIKWMEYSLMGLATVVSPTATYVELLEDERHVLFASDQQGWVMALERLIGDPSLRRDLALQAHERAMQLFGPSVGNTFWQALLPDATVAPVRRVLLINCFFAPQSVGGATRVAQDRVRELLASSTPEQPVEVTVLCTDLDPWQGSPVDGAMPLDVHQWFGAKVVRLGLPGKPWDWHHDGEVERFCREWFQRESFDEIEAHAMQILTAAPLRVALSLGIPYKVVLHDGWWLSRLQFLTREDGTAVNPLAPLSDLDPEASDDERQALRERQLDLLEILAGAEERLAVSESFADLHRRAGVRNVGVRRNRAPEPAAQAQAHAASRWATAAKGTDPVRFCMVGGMAVHKGYAVLRSAIQAAQLGEKARFTVVDHRLRADEPAYGVRWGGSAVEFIPPVPMAEMQTFYTSQDVLIAPSIWPESFGLVTREALAAGLWVIASQAGALAEPIEHAVNGLVVQPGSVEELRVALIQSAQELRLNHNAATNLPR
jgi:glycosyltransferase involved in cell wall biosynthesis